MGSVVNLGVKTHRHAVERTVWDIRLNVSALQVLANDGSLFFAEEVRELRQMSNELLGIAQQAEANMDKGFK